MPSGHAPSACGTDLSRRAWTCHERSDRRIAPRPTLRSLLSPLTLRLLLPHLLLSVCCCSSSAVVHFSFPCNLSPFRSLCRCRRRCSVIRSDFCLSSVVSTSIHERRQPGTGYGSAKRRPPYATAAAVHATAEHPDGLAYAPRIPSAVFPWRCSLLTCSSSSPSANGTQISMTWEEITKHVASGTSHTHHRTPLSTQ